MPALRLEYETYKEALDRGRAELSSLLGQISTAAASAAVVLGVFGATRPEADSALATGLFLGGLVPFLAIFLLALWVGWESELLVIGHGRPKPSGRRMQHYRPFGTIATPEQLAERQRAQTRADELARRSKTARGPLAGAADALGQSEYPFWKALLSEDNWLLLTLEELEQAYKWIDFEVGQAQNMRLAVAALLGLEVLYLVVVAAMTQFIV